jgi:hypothetical protein
MGYDPPQDCAMECATRPCRQGTASCGACVESRNSLTSVRPGRRQCDSRSLSAVRVLDRPRSGSPVMPDMAAGMMDAVWTMDALRARPARPVSHQPHCVALSSTLSRDTAPISLWQYSSRRGKGGGGNNMVYPAVSYNLTRRAAITSRQRRAMVHLILDRTS